MTLSMLSAMQTDDYGRLGYKTLLKQDGNSEKFPLQIQMRELSNVPPHLQIPTPKNMKTPPRRNMGAFFNEEGVGIKELQCISIILIILTFSEDEFVATSDLMEKALNASIIERVPSAESFLPVNGKESGPLWHWALRFILLT